MTEQKKIKETTVSLLWHLLARVLERYFWIDISKQIVEKELTPEQKRLEEEADAIAENEMTEKEKSKKKRLKIRAEKQAAREKKEISDRNEYRPLLWAFQGVRVLSLLIEAGFIWYGFTWGWKGWGMCLIPIAVMLLLSSMKTVQSHPPTVALATICGTRIPYVMREGIRILSPFSSFLCNIITICIRKENWEWTFEDIRTRAKGDTKKRSKEDQANTPDDKKTEDEPKSGGEITINVDMTVQPDYKHPITLIRHLNTGGIAKAEPIAKGITEQAVRQMGREYNWEQYTFGASGLTRELILKTTGEDLDPETEWEELAGNGLPDAIDLGIVFSRITIGKISEQGKLKDAAETTAIQLQEQEAQKLKFIHVSKMIKLVHKTGISIESAKDVVQTQLKVVTKTINENVNKSNNINKLDIVNLDAPKIASAIIQVIDAAKQ